MPNPEPEPVLDCEFGCSRHDDWVVSGSVEK